MSMNVGNASGEGEVMVEMNTTPLIDVMLVLLTPSDHHPANPDPCGEAGHAHAQCHASDRHSGDRGAGRGL